MSETRRHCTQEEGVFPQAGQVGMTGNSSSLPPGEELVGTYAAEEDWGFAGLEARVSTGVSTRVEKVQKCETSPSHRGSFLLKMGKSVSKPIALAAFCPLLQGFCEPRHCEEDHG